MLGVITAAANVWCLGPINQRYIPQAVRQAEIVLERTVSPISSHSDGKGCCKIYNSALTLQDCTSYDQC